MKCKRGHPIVGMSFTAEVCCYGAVSKDADGCVVFHAERAAEIEGVDGAQIFDWRETTTPRGRVFYCADVCEPTAEEELT